MNRSQTVRLIQTLTDSIGPRLTGTPQMTKGQDWLARHLRAVGRHRPEGAVWHLAGVAARAGAPRPDPAAARARSREPCWPGAAAPRRESRPKAAPSSCPSLADSAAYEAWYPTVKGKHVLISAPQPTCRPDSSYRALRAAGDLQEDGGRPERGEPGVAGRGSGRPATRRVTCPCASRRRARSGILTSLWSQGWGVNKIFSARTRTIPSVDVSLRGLRPASTGSTDNGQDPVLRITADAEFLGDVPSFNVIGEIRGTEKPDRVRRALGALRFVGRRPRAPPTTPPAPSP